jgi:hypothetical protein
MPDKGANLDEAYFWGKISYAKILFPNAIMTRNKLGQFCLHLGSVDL